ncbi:hypothetical protein [Xenorhabdus hominickii]|uniref:hypothetical protein n=1 Tax=Xenorhabdus hominickii TaxID=351679 RepID=UPI000C045652|nr:hypothetical protein [Xenorhabdus hominickii]
MGFAEEHEITESLFLDFQRRNDVVALINQHCRLSLYENGFWYKIKVKAGLISQEGVDKTTAEKS